MSKDNLNETEPQLKKPLTEAQQQVKTLTILLVVAALLVGIGMYFHLNSEPTHQGTEALFKARKSPDAYSEYIKNEQSSKKKAERNIFLQDD